MFLEPLSRQGWIEVVCGSMFSGKTEELLRRIKRAQIANLNVEIFKPAIDKRYDINDVVSHNNSRIVSTPVEHSNSILLQLREDTDVVAIDEAQFFDQDILNVVDHLANSGKRVIVAGLDMDFKGQPFGPMPQLMSMAEYITKLHAICVKCGGIAQYSFRKVAKENTVLLGEKETYEPRCRKCFHE